MAIHPQYVVLLHHLRRVLAAAAERDIAVMPLKGAYLLTQVYPEGASRGLLADVDVLVRPACARAMAQVMEAAGFVPRDESFAPRALHERGYYLPLPNGRRILFEVHTHLVHPRRFFVDHDALWARSRPGALDGAPCRMMDPVDALCHVCLHGALHRWMYLDRDVADVAALLRWKNLDPDTVVERARAWRITRMVWFALHCAAAKDAALVPPSLRAALAPPLLVEVALRALAAERAAVAKLPHRIQAGVWWPWIFDSRRQMLRFLWNHPARLSAWGADPGGAGD